MTKKLAKKAMRILTGEVGMRGAREDFDVGHLPSRLRTRRQRTCCLVELKLRAFTTVVQ